MRTSALSAGGSSGDCAPRSYSRVGDAALLKHLTHVAQRVRPVRDDAADVVQVEAGEGRQRSREARVGAGSPPDAKRQPQVQLAVGGQLLHGRDGGLAARRDAVRGERGANGGAGGPVRVDAQQHAALR